MRRTSNTDGKINGRANNGFAQGRAVLAVPEQNRSIMNGYYALMSRHAFEEFKIATINSQDISLGA